MEIYGIKKDRKNSFNGMEGIRLSYYAAFSQTGFPAGECPVIDSFSFDDIFSLCGCAASPLSREIHIYAGGWQSWSPGWELGPGEKLPRKVKIIPELIKLTNRPGDNPGPGEILGHFIMYLRIGAGDDYFCIAAKEGGNLPPVSYRINRKKRRIAVETYCPGKEWKDGDCLAELFLFRAGSFFALKDTLAGIYRQEDRFRELAFLCDADAGAAPFPWGKKAIPGGYESWYNHYNAITEKIILDDLHALDKTGNIIKLWYIDRKKPVVFQIDDGWEMCVGEWEIDRKAFPNGLQALAGQIEKAGYIPGLWIAPFLVTRSCRIFSEKPEWVLRDSGGNPVVAGFNHLWDRQYYCLDISRPDVLDYMEALIRRAIDEWGFRYLKLDFLYTGMFPGNFFKKGSPYEHYERACKILTNRTRTQSGLPVAYLGCGLPFGSSYPFFPLTRIGADTREMWDWNMVKMLGHTGRPSAYINLHDTIGRSFMDNAVYINDPDVIFLRDKNCKLSMHEKETIALINFLLAGQIMFSDDPLNMEEADKELTGRIAGLYSILSNDEYGAVRLARDVFHLESRSGKIRGLINLGSHVFILDKNGHEGLFKFLSKNEILVDHRRNIRQNSIGFLPHTITISVAQSWSESGESDGLGRS